MTEDNVITLFGEYALKHHADLLAETSPKSPFFIDDGDNDTVGFFTSVWALYHAVIPSTGLRISEEFASRCIDDPVLAAKMRRADDLIIDGFEVLESKDGVFTIRSVTTRKTYRVIPGGPKVASTLVPGTVKMCAIHPWEADGTHMVDGTMNHDLSDIVCKDDSGYYYSGNESIETSRGARASPADRAIAYAAVPFLDYDTVMGQLTQDWQKDVESIKITARSKVAPALKKYPGHWTKAMCHAVGIRPASHHRDRAKDISAVLTSEGVSRVLSKLSGEQLDCLRYVAASGGSVKFHTLEENFGPDDTDYYWKARPQSVIGALRRTGILLVGLKTVNTRNYRVGAIAADVLANLTRMGFADGVSDASKLVSRKKSPRGPDFGAANKGASTARGDPGGRSRWRMPKWLTRNRVRFK